MSDLDREAENAVRARMGAVRRPWFLPIALVIVLAAPLTSSTLTVRLCHANADIGPLFALAAGLLAAISVLGHSPAAYPDPATGQSSLYWSPCARRTRIVLGALAFLLALSGIVLDCLSQ